jgi:beta-lactam-binding protein with PASTA domain
VIAVEAKYTNRVPEGTVLCQSPKHRAVVEEGSVVELIVVHALPFIPNVVGKGIDAARRTLGKDGFDVSVKKQESSQPKDTIISQFPAAGTSARPGRVVQVIVAKVEPGAFGNPWGFNFDCCSLIYNPPSNFCDYFP